MDYDYTKLLQQAIRFYTIKKWPIPFFKNGVTLQQVIILGVVLVLTLVVLALTLLGGVDFTVKLLFNGWILILGGMGVAAWALFSLSWDQKNFFRYIWDRYQFRKQHVQQFEHGSDVVLPLDSRVTYGAERRRGNG